VAGGTSIFEDDAMNNDIGGNRGPRRAAFLAVVAAVAVLAAACGGSTSSSSADAGVSAAYRQALAYSQCMRTHGVPDFPDPNANGTTVISPSSPINSSSGQFQAASNACQNLQPGGDATPPAQTPQELAQSLRLAQCMRTHGVPDFPDPGSAPTGSPAGGKNGGLASMMNSPQAQAALRTCQSLLHIPPKPGRP
jgi:hypothetical protein